MYHKIVPEHSYYPRSSNASSQVLRSVLGQSANLEQKGRASHALHRSAFSWLLHAEGYFRELF